VSSCPSVTSDLLSSDHHVLTEEQQNSS